MRIIALDPSLTATGVAMRDALDTPCGITYTIQPKKMKGAERLLYIRNEVKHLVTMEAKVPLVVIEGYALKAHGAVYAGELGGVIRLWLYEHGVPWVEVPPQILKMIATGKGNAKKELVRDAAIRRLEYPGSSQDEVEALWLLHLALHAYSLPGRTDLPKSHLRAVRRVEWPNL